MVEGGTPQTILAKDSAINLKLKASDVVPSDKNMVTVRVSATVDGQPLARENSFNLKIRSK